MAKWTKLLQRMLEDTNPGNYRYDEAVRILDKLGFTLAPSGGGSHRTWRREVRPGVTARVGLVDKGHGTLKAVYIVEMIKVIREYGLIPADLDGPGQESEQSDDTE